MPPSVFAGEAWTIGGFKTPLFHPRGPRLNFLFVLYSRKGESGLYKKNCFFTIIYVLTEQKIVIMFVFNNPTFLPCVYVKHRYVLIVFTCFLKEENDVGEFFLTLEKDPQQEDFLQGRMQGNPYRSVLIY